MIIISHRGNLNGAGSQCERQHVEEALLRGYDVEVDVRSHVWRLYVGHDAPLFELPREWVRTEVSSRLWFHAKDERCHDALALVGHRVFMHDDEPHGMVVPDGLLWVHPRANNGASLESQDVVLLDIEGHPKVDRSKLSKLPTAVCTDWPDEWRIWLKDRTT